MLELRKGTELKGRYVIHDVIGTGGYASVWKASDKKLNRDVALKRLLKHSAIPSQEEMSALLEEARKHAQLVHTNIVQVYDIIEAEGEHLIVMEYIDGPHGNSTSSLCACGRPSSRNLKSSCRSPKQLRRSLARQSGQKL